MHVNVTLAMPYVNIPLTTPYASHRKHASIPLATPYASHKENMLCAQNVNTPHLRTNVLLLQVCCPKIRMRIRTCALLVGIVNCNFAHAQILVVIFGQQTCMVTWDAERALRLWATLCSFIYEPCCHVFPISTKSYAVACQKSGGGLTIRASTSISLLCSLSHASDNRSGGGGGGGGGGGDCFVRETVQFVAIDHSFSKVCMQAY